MGFPIAAGTVVVMLCATMGADHEDEEHEQSAGALAIIDSIEMIGGDQGLGLHIVIPVDPAINSEEEDALAIVNTFDEGDTVDRFAFRLATDEERAKLHPSWIPPARRPDRQQRHLGAIRVGALDARGEHP